MESCMKRHQQKISLMDVFLRICFFVLMFIKICGCSACMTHRNQSKNICCEDIYASGMYTYSADTNWTTDKLHSEVWLSENVPLAFIEYAPFSRNSSAVVEEVLSGSIYLKRCLNLTYSATDEKFKEICIHFIVTGCPEKEHNNASKVTSNLQYLAVLVPIIGLACIFGI